MVTTIFASAGRGRTVFRIVPVAQINALMIISGEPGLAENIISWAPHPNPPPLQFPPLCATPFIGGQEG